ncbi:thioredoxin domain-containing protein [Sphingomonas sp. BK345]|uniref:DsbA family protein n=1 Tax=Sphingomonas sp. BK345 TaxID=2586980 RepID=UPI001612E7EF|nr:thioredoxin domain-containing protein [Sphingomonas sp. BK345]MBB3471862.1 protein-disulfide isomerase [Sphingomonas sp. BK345]
MTRFRSVLLPLAALALGTAAGAAAPRPWTAVATPVATGSYLIGNPKARVKLVEYVSYTCPHCGHFAAESRATLGAMVRSGSTSVEVRNQIHDGIDLAAATLARCAGPAAFPALHEAFFAKQEEWYERAAEWSEGNRARIASWPQLDQLKAVAQGAGLDAIAKQAGAPAAAIDACFASDAQVKRAIAASEATSKVKGTPAFELNGKLIENVGWAQLEPQLRAAGAR